MNRDPAIEETETFLRWRLWKQQHPYPFRYPRGAHWATDEAWRIVDRLPVGADDYRAVLSGMIGGAMTRIVDERGRANG